MYTDYWQLQQKPFEPNIAGGFFYPSEAHHGALLKLRYAVESGRGAAVVAGPSGVGKTLLAHTLFDQLPETTTPIVHVVYPQMPPRELLAYIAARLAPYDHPPTVTPSVDQSWLRIENALTESAEHGERPMLVLDEAHLLEDSGALETIRLLLNLQRDGDPLLTVLLVGHTALLAILQRTPRLEERLDIAALLEPLTSDEVPAYVAHRIRAAGGQRELFTAAAIDALALLSHGVPRRINRLGDLALLVGYASEADVIDEELIESVASDLALARAA